MRPLHSALCGLVGVALLAVAPIAARAADLPKLSDEQQKQLADLDPEFAAECVEIAQQIETWKKEFEAARKQVEAWKKQVEEARKNLENKAEVTLGVLQAAKAGDPKAIETVYKAVETLAKRSERFRKLINYAEKLEKRFKAVETEVNAIKYDAEKFAGLTEQDFRELATNHVRQQIAMELMASIDSEVLVAVNAIKDPAAVAKHFAESFVKGEFKEWLTKPRKIPDTELEVTIKPVDGKLALFSPKTEITVEVTYGKKVTVEATGIFFKYKSASPYYTLDTKSMKVSPKTDLKKMALDNLKGLGEEFLESLDLPINLGDFKEPDFTSKTPVLKAMVTIDFKGVLPVKATGEVTLYSNGKVEFGDMIKIDVKLKAPVLIPGTPAAIFGIGGGINLKKKEVSVTGVISAASPGIDEVIALDVTLTLNPKDKTLTVDGGLKMAKAAGGGFSLGKVHGSLGPKGFDLKVEIPGDPGSPVAKIIKGEAKLSITKERLTANGDMVLYSAFPAKFSLVINNNGSGRFTGAANAKILGVAVDGAITADFQKNFSDLILKLNAQVEVNLGGVLQADVVSVELVAKETEIDVTAHGFGETISFTIKHDSNLQKELQKKFEAVLKKAVDICLNALAACDPTSKNSFAGKLTKEFDPFNRDSVANHVGKELDPTNPNSVAGKFFKSIDPSKVAGDLGIKIDLPSRQDLENKAKDKLNISNWHLRRTGPPSRLQEAALLMALTTLAADQATEQEFAKRLTQGVVSLQDIAIGETMKPTSSVTPAGRTARGSSVHARILSPAMTTISDTEILIGFVIKTSGSCYTVKPGQNPERLTGSEALGGSIRLTRQPGEKIRWKGKIHLPKIHWEKYSYQDLSLKISQEIERRLEAMLPEVDIEGLRLWSERQLAVENKTKETLTVNVQRRTSVRVKDRFEWVWIGGTPGKGKAESFKVKPGEKVLLTNKLLGREGDAPLTASRVRLWMESESGERWDQHQGEDLWLVAENPKLGGNREYQAEAVGMFTYTVVPKTGTRVYGERVVEVANQTDKPLSVRLGYLVTEGGQQRWRTLPDFEVPAKGTARPRDAGGQLVHASAIKILAANESIGYREHHDKPIWLIDDIGDGRRLYRSDKIGQYVHTFKPLNVPKPEK